jgi:hypothetical protein
MCIQFKQYGRSGELVSGGNGVVASIENVSGPVLCELIFAQLE